MFRISLRASLKTQIRPVSSWGHAPLSNSASDTNKGQLIQFHLGWGPGERGRPRVCGRTPNLFRSRPLGQLDQVVGAEPFGKGGAGGKLPGVMNPGPGA